MYKIIASSLLLFACMSGNSLAHDYDYSNLNQVSQFINATAYNGYICASYVDRNVDHWDSHEICLDYRANLSKLEQMQDTILNSSVKEATVRHLDSILLNTDIIYANLEIIYDMLTKDMNKYEF